MSWHCGSAFEVAFRDVVKGLEQVHGWRWKVGLDFDPGDGSFIFCQCLMYSM